MRGSAPSSATTTTSDGPPGRSIGTSRETSSFASFTYALPGPTILSTRADVREPADRLRPAERPDLVDPEQLGRGGDEAGARGRRADDDPLDARGLRGHGAHDERRDEAARHVDADRLRAAPSARSSTTPGSTSSVDVARPLRLVPAAHAVGEREQRLAREQRPARRRARAPARRRRARAPTRAPRRVAALADVARRSLRRSLIASHPLDGTSRIDDAPARLEPRQQPPDVGGRDERVHRDHARLGERQHARRARAGDERADLVERRLAARSASGSGARAPRRPRAASTTSCARVGALAADQHRLRREQRAERAQAVRAQRVPARDEVDDRVGEPEPRRDLDRAGDVDELDRRPASARASSRG